VVNAHKLRKPVLNSLVPEALVLRAALDYPDPVQSACVREQLLAVQGVWLRRLRYACRLAPWLIRQVLLSLAFYEPWPRLGLCGASVY